MNHQIFPRKSSRDSEIATLLSALFLLAAGSLPVAGQGSLDPPDAGPPGETMRTLTQVEARTPVDNDYGDIDAPGSYYLTEDIVGDAGIDIEASNVTVDLNGFSVRKEEGSRSGSGIFISSVFNRLENVTVKNGHIAGRWLIALSAGGVSNLTLKNLSTEGTNRGFNISTDDDEPCEGVQILNCSIMGSPETGDVPSFHVGSDNNGIKLVNATNFRIQGCTISGFSGDGIDIAMIQSAVRPLGLITGCQIFNVAQNGISTRNTSGGVSDTLIIRDVTVSLAHLTGIELETNAVVENVVVSKSGEAGLIGNKRMVVKGSNFFQNGFNTPNQGGGGALLASGKITDSTAHANNGPGFVITEGGISGCTSTYNVGHGFALGQGAMIRDSTAAHNGDDTADNFDNSIAADGINGGDGVFIEGCATYSNSQDGIEAGVDAFVARNQSYANQVNGLNIDKTASVRGNNSSGNGTQYSAAGSDIADVEAGSTATAPDYNTQ